MKNKKVRNRSRAPKNTNSDCCDTIFDKLQEIAKRENVFLPIKNTSLDSLSYKIVSQSYYTTNCFGLQVPKNKKVRNRSRAPKNTNSDCCDTIEQKEYCHIILPDGICIFTKFIWVGYAKKGIVILCKDNIPKLLFNCVAIILYHKLFWIASAKNKKVRPIRDAPKNASLNVATHLSHQKGRENTFLPKIVFSLSRGAIFRCVAIILYHKLFLIASALKKYL